MLFRSTAPGVLLLSPNTQQGVFDIVLAMTLRDFGKPAFSLRKLRENTCTIATGWLKNLHSAIASFPRFFSGSVGFKVADRFDVFGKFHDVFSVIGLNTVLIWLRL